MLDLYGADKVEWPSSWLAEVKGMRRSKTTCQRLDRYPIWMPTLNSDFAVWVLGCRLLICALVFFVVFELVAELIKARRVWLENVSLIAGMLDSLNSRSVSFGQL